MPYHVAKTGKCPSSKPWGVIKDSDGEVMGCHATKGDAQDQLAAIMANEKGASPTLRIHGILPGMMNSHIDRSQFITGQPGHRHVRGVQFREMNPSSGRFVARVMQYDVVDDYRTIFAPGVFAESLQQRLPKVVWAHDWTDPLGRYVDYDDTRTHLDLVGELDLQMIEMLSSSSEDATVTGYSPAVPRAHQAYAQLKSGTIDEFSVGFMPQDGEEIMVDERYYFKFTRARLDEASLVLAGAVPGTELLAVRTRTFLLRGPATISKELAAQTILDLHEGKIDLADALQQIKTSPESTTEEEPTTEPPTPEGESTPLGDGEPPPEPPAEPTSEPPAEPTTEPEPETQDLDWAEFEDVDTLVDDLAL